MKSAQLEKILLAVEAKASNAKARLAEARRRQRALFDEADRYEREALGPADAADVADLVAADRRSAALVRKAARLREEARAMDPEIGLRAASLKAALKEEIAWRRLQRRARTEAQRRRAAMEEERREAVAALKG